MNTSSSPAITVLMAVYNGERYVKEAVDSILDQTFRDFEFIIVDDASDDTTAAILRSYHDPRIIVLRNEKNIGLTRSLNAGIAIARGTYIVRMDADDISFPERLAIEKNFLDSHPDIAAVGGETDIINETGKKVGAKRALQDHERIRFRMVFANQFAHPTVAIRKRVIEEVGGYNDQFRYVQDYELWSRLIERNYHLTNIPVPLIRYRYHAQSITQGRDSKDQAYAFAAAVIRKNISRYMACTDREFSVFLKSLHHHRIDSFSEMLTALRFWARLKKAYLKKEAVSPENKEFIYTYILREQRGILQWYAKQRFGILYKIVAKIWKSMTSAKQ